MAFQMVVLPSSFGHLIAELRRRLMEDLEFILRISRDHDSVADCLASIVTTNMISIGLYL